MSTGQLCKMAERGLWNDLRASLRHDVRDLPLVIPPRGKSLCPPWVHVIHAIVDTYMNRNEDRPDDYNYWQLKPETVRRASVNESLSGGAGQTGENGKGPDRAKKRLRSSGQWWTSTLMCTWAAHVSGGSVPIPAIECPLPFSRRAGRQNTTEHSWLRNSDRSGRELSRYRRPPPRNFEITRIHTGPQLRLQIPKSILMTNHFFHLLLDCLAVLPSL